MLERTVQLDAHQIETLRLVEDNEGLNGGTSVGLLNTTKALHNDDVVPGGLGELHPVVATLRNDTARMAMPGDVRDRALRLLQVLATAAIERGWDVSDVPVNLEGCHTDFQQTARYRAATIAIELCDFRYEVTVDQKSPKAPDLVKSRHLKISLPQSLIGAQSNWADTKRASLEQRLPEVIEALTQRAATDEIRSKASALAREARQATEAADAARDLARAKEAFLAQELDRQARAWQRWQLLTAYCRQFEEQLQAADPQAPEYESARQWLAWAKAHTRAIDPLKTLPGMPMGPESGLAPASGQNLPDPMSDVIPGKWPINRFDPDIWDRRRRFRPNG